MSRFDGSLALKLDFGAVTTTARSAAVIGAQRSFPATRALKVAEVDKYKVLDHRRHQAQIRARHLLQLMEEH